jgi:hypothetical protein
LPELLILISIEKVIDAIFLNGPRIFNDANMKFAKCKCAPVAPNSG